MPTACPQRQSNSHLALSAAGLGEEHVGNVGTGDDQHQEHCRLQHPQGFAQIAGVQIADGRHSDAPVLVGIRMLPGQVPSQHFHLFLRLRKSDAGPQPCNDMQEMKLAVLKQFGGKSQRSPEIDESPRVGELRRHHSDNRVGLSVQPDRPANHVSVGGKLLFPEPMTQDEHMILARFPVLRQKSTAQERLCSKQRKQVGGKLKPHYRQRRPSVGQSVRLIHGVGHVFKDMVASFPIGVVGARHFVLCLSLQIHLPDRDQPVGLSIGQRSQQHRMENTENSGVRTNAQGQSDDGSNGKARALEQLTDSVAKVVDHSGSGLVIRGSSSCCDELPDP